MWCVFVFISSTASSFVIAILCNDLQWSNGVDWVRPGIEGEEWSRFRSSEASCWGNVRTTVMAGLISMLFLAVLCSCHIGFGKWKLLYWISKMWIYRKFGGIQWFLCLFVSQLWHSESLCFPRPRRGTEQSHELQGLKRSEDGAGLDIFPMIQILIYWQWRCLCSLSYTEFDRHLFWQTRGPPLCGEFLFRGMDLAEVPPGWSCGWLILVISMLWSQRISGAAERGGRERATNWGHLLLQNHMQCENAHSKDQQLGASSFFPVTWALPEVPGKIQSDSSSNLLVSKTKAIKSRQN